MTFLIDVNEPEGESEEKPLDLEEATRPAPRSGWRRYGFAVALVVSWLLHMVVLVWLSAVWPVVKPPPMQYMPVELVYLPAPRKSVEAPKEVEAVAAENQQANVPQASQEREALSPVAQPDPSTAPPPVPLVVEGDQPAPPAPPAEPQATAPSLPKPIAPAKSRSERGVKPAPEPVAEKKSPVVVQSKPAKPTARPVVAPPVVEPQMPNLSLTPSLGEMARWDQARQKRQREEVFKREEETVSLNTQKVRYAAYFSRLKERIQQGWIYPAQAKKEKLSGMLTMRFTINRDGAITDIIVEDSSGSALLDDAAVQALRGATPFMPLPEDWELERLHVKTIFEYVRGGFRWGQ